ncbi:hypothetical protein M413DRAFT_447644 [Hebeloma cylindrosporum]|uniref:Endoplasmic reticulum junction formation protein lunapark n=1 Tax=Hebeloma cylindrosporum TaxID=76867 RepID=A0A0C3C530_HEBCY|nr:hypothetical protein M413DRAFT_447644 [Hebeloma cylindrosporum h7]
MSFIRRIFSKKSEEDYETVLSNLANDIQKRQTKLSEIRLRERRSTLVVTLYTLAAWVGYVSLWYLNALPGLKDGRYIRNGSTEKVFKTLPVIIGPIMVLFIRRVVQIWYKNKGDAEEKTLKDLMKTRRDKVEEIKKKTNYYSTRDLLQKYDESSPSTPLPRRLNPGQPPSTPQGRPIPNNGKIVPQTPAPPSSGLQSHLSPMTPSYQVAPPRKQWYDKLADAILGDDDATFASPSARYALICEKCFNHNGLVKESMWEEAQYVCPKCGHFNASVRAKKARPRQSLSPTPSPSQSPQGPQPVPSAASHAPNEPERDLPTVDGPEPTPMEVDTTEGAPSP